MTAQRMPQVSRDVKDAANAQDINRKNPSARRVDKIGLWGDSIEGVAANPIQQQLVSKLEAGPIRLTANS